MKIANPIASHDGCLGFLCRPTCLFLGKRAKGVYFLIGFVQARIHRIDYFYGRHFLLANGRSQRRGWHKAEILSVSFLLLCPCLILA